MFCRCHFPDHQFVSSLTDDLENDITALQDVLSDVLEFCQRAYDISGLGRNQKFEPRDLLQLAAVKAPKSASTHNLSQNRAYHWLKANLNVRLGKVELASSDLPLESLIIRIAAKLYDDFRADFEKIEDIVRTTRLNDPIELEADKIVEFESSKYQAAAENAKPFVSRPGHDTMTWLSSVQDDPELIAQWKSKLLQQVQNAEGSKDQDSVGT